MHSNFMMLPDYIVCKITQRNSMRRANICDPALKLLNEEITSDIHTHKQNIWKEHLDAHWDHRHNMHIPWNTIHGLSNRAHPPKLNTSITFSYKTASTQQIRQPDTLTEQHKKMQGHNITLTTTHVQEAIKQSKITTHMVLTH